jgi:signal transduction histidine kinase
MQFNLYITLLSLSFIISGALTFVAFSRRKTVRGGSYFSVMMLAISLWSFAAAFEQAVTNIEFKIFWSVVCYVSIPLIPILFFIFVIKFTQTDDWLTPSIERSLFLFPICSFILAATNQWHNLLWSEISLGTSIGGITAKYGHGNLFFVVVIFTYFAVFLTVFQLLKADKIYKGVFKKQIRLLIVAQVFPIAINSIYVFYGEVIDFIDPTPVAFTITGILMAISIFKYSFLDLIPVARNIMFDNLTEGVLVLDLGKRVVDVNRTFISFFGKQNLIGKTLLEEFSSIPELIEICRNDTSTKIEFTYQNKYYSAISIKVFTKKGEIHGKLISVADVTELKEKERVLLQNQTDLKELNIAKDKLLSIIAHDLKNPFFGIIGLSDILIEDYDEMSNDEKMKFLNDINQVAKDTFKMLENLLEWSQQQTGAMVFEPVSFDINELIKTTITGYRPQAVLKNIKLEIELNYGMFVLADVNMIKTVLRNLITNAIKFTKPGGKILLKSEVVSNFANISVMDNGVGISEGDLKKLFKIDESLRSVGTLGEKGTGLGLLLCHDFIKQNGGTISAKQNPPEGTTFSFTLPISSKVIISDK